MKLTIWGSIYFLRPPPPPSIKKVVNSFCSYFCQDGMHFAVLIKAYLPDRSLWKCIPWSPINPCKLQICNEKWQSLIRQQRPLLNSVADPGGANRPRPPPLFFWGGRRKKRRKRGVFSLSLVSPFTFSFKCYRNTMILYPCYIVCTVADAIVACATARAPPMLFPLTAWRVV